MSFFPPSLVQSVYPYLVPVIPDHTQYANVRYVDPTLSSNGNGTIENPFNTIQGLTIAPNTAYLIKAGTVLNERLDKSWNNNLVGRYGQGDRPVVNGGFRFGEGVNGIVVRDLRVIREGTGTSGTASASAIFYNTGTPHNITVAFCDIEGIYNPSLAYPYRYPAFAFNNRVGSSYTIFNNKIGNIGSKAIYSVSPNFSFVRNYVYNINRGAWSGLPQDQDGGVGHGNAFSFRFWRENVYIAGNYFDPYRDFHYQNQYAGKSCFALVAGWDDMTPNNTTAEYNTIISPPAMTTTGNGGLSYSPPNETIFRYNVIDASTKGEHQGIVPIVGGQWAARQAYEAESEVWGIRNNHIIKWDANQDVAWPEAAITYVTEEGRNNVIYNNWAAYVADTGKESWSSDIDTDTFLTDTEILHPPDVTDLLQLWEPFTFTPLYGLVNTSTIIAAYNTQWNDIADNLSLLRQIAEILTDTQLTWDNTAITPITFQMRAFEIRDAINNNNTILFANMDAVYTAVVELHAVPGYDSTPVTLLTTPTQQEFVSAHNLNLGLLIVNTTELYNVLTSYYGY